MPLQFTKQEIIAFGGPDTIKVFGGNPNRVFATFTLHSGFASVLLSPIADGLFTSAFADLAQVTFLELFRHDIGELLTGDLWLGNGGGIAPNCDVTVIEGIDLP
jgi:hypothetical protein